MEKKGRVEYRYSPSNIFCLKVPKSFVGELLVCLFFRVSKKFMLQRVLSRFSIDFFLSHSTETLVEGPFSAVFQKIAGSEDVSGKEGGGGSIETFRRKIYASNCRKIL